MSKILTKTVKTRKPDTRIQSLVSKSKYPKCHKCTNPSPSPPDNCDVVTCGGRKIFFRNFSPTTLTSDMIKGLGITLGDVWFDCSQIPSKEYIFVSGSQNLYASDSRGNVYTVSTITGLGTQVSLYGPLFDNVVDPAINGDIVLNRNMPLGYVFGSTNSSPSYAAIYEFSLTSMNLTGRTTEITQLTTNPDCLSYAICAGAYFQNTFYICVYVRFVNPLELMDTYYINQLYAVDTSGTNITTTYIGNITGIPLDIPLPDYTASQVETVTGMVLDEISNTIYFVTSYNENYISYRPSTLYSLNLTTLVATPMVNLMFPALPAIVNPVANSLTIYKNVFYVGSFSKFDPGYPNFNSPYLFTMTLDGNLTAVSTINKVFLDSEVGGVVGLSAQSDYFTQIGI